MPLSMRLPTREELKPIAKTGLRNLQTALSLAYMSVPYLAKLAAEGATIDEIRDAQVKMAYVIGVTAFAETFARITGNLAYYFANKTRYTTQAINTFPTVAALFMGAASAVLTGAMYAAPGEDMKKFGPWLIAATAFMTYLFSQFVFKKADANNTITAQTTNNNQGKLQQLIAFSVTPLGIASFLTLPIASAEIVERVAFAAASTTLRERAPYAGDGLWTLGTMFYTTLATIAAFRNLSPRTIDLARGMIGSVVIGLSVMITMIGHAGKFMDTFAPFFARAFCLLAMGIATRLNQLIASGEEAAQQNRLMPIEYINRGLHLLAIFAQDTIVPMTLASNALRTDGVTSELYRKSMQIVLGINLFDSFVSGAFSNPRAKTNWAFPAFVLLGLQTLFMLFSTLDTLGKATTHATHHDLRPVIGMLSALFYFVYKQTLALHGEAVVVGNNHRDTAPNEQTLLRTATANRNEHDSNLQVAPEDATEQQSTKTTRIDELKCHFFGNGYSNNACVVVGQPLGYSGAPQLYFPSPARRQSMTNGV